MRSFRSLATQACLSDDCTLRYESACAWYLPTKATTTSRSLDSMRVAMAFQDSPKAASLCRETPPSLRPSKAAADDR